MVPPPSEKRQVCLVAFVGQGSSEHRGLDLVTASVPVVLRRIKSDQFTAPVKNSSAELTAGLREVTWARITGS